VLAHPAKLSTNVNSTGNSNLARFLMIFVTLRESLQPEFPFSPSKHPMRSPSPNSASSRGPAGDRVRTTDSPNRLGRIADARCLPSSRGPCHGPSPSWHCSLVVFYCDIPLGMVLRLPKPETNYAALTVAAVSA